MALLCCDLVVWVDLVVWLRFVCRGGILRGFVDFLLGLGCGVGSIMFGFCVAG